MSDAPQAPERPYPWSRALPALIAALFGVIGAALGLAVFLLGWYLTDEESTFAFLYHDRVWSGLFGAALVFVGAAQVKDWSSPLRDDLERFFEWRWNDRHGVGGK